MGCLACMLPGCGSFTSNRLEHATSPYLKEHADNPVDWYEWGDEALGKAKKENKPLLISIGYAACHWCHEMERESFMDTAVARIMNERFVCIKVDREERPDLDQVYSDACQLLTGSSGWPLNAFALPDGKPFFAGTYYNKASWTNLLNRIADAYSRTPGKVKLQADGLAMGLKEQVLSIPGDSVTTSFMDFYQQVMPGIAEQLDPLNGGIKSPVKFPSPFLINYLLQDFYSTGNEVSLKHAILTLDKMASGGIHDQVGGGFSRYTVDSNWHTPHFEKMLYDNAQLVTVYSQAYQLTDKKEYRTIAENTASFLLDELISPEGLFYSSLNADSDGGEGNFYTWTSDELRKVLDADYELIARYFNIHQGRSPGRQVLAPGIAAAEFVAKEALDSASFQQVLGRSKDRMLAARGRRSRPSVDEKILTSWNALALTAFLDLYAATGERKFYDVALKMATAMESRLIAADGTLNRSLINGKGAGNGMLEDYAFASDAMIRLYQLSFNKHWLDIAYKLTRKASELFYDNKSGFYYTSVEPVGQSGIRSIAIADNGVPSPNAMLGKAMCYLALYYQDDALLDRSQRMLESFSRQKPSQAITSYASWYSLAGLHAFGLNEVVVVGADAPSLNAGLQRHYLPLSAVMGSPGKEDLPLLEGKNAGKVSLIYVCANRTCKRPVTDVASALTQIRAPRLRSIIEKY